MLHLFLAQLNLFFKSYLDPLYRSSYLGQTYKLLVYWLFLWLLTGIVPKSFSISFLLVGYLGGAFIFSILAYIQPPFNLFNSSLSSSSISSSYSSPPRRTFKQEVHSLDLAFIITQAALYYLNGWSLLHSLHSLGICRTILYAEFFNHWLPFLIYQVRSGLPFRTNLKKTYSFFVVLSVALNWIFDIYFAHETFSSLFWSWAWLMLHIGTGLGLKKSKWNPPSSTPVYSLAPTTSSLSFSSSYYALIFFVSWMIALMLWWVSFQWMTDVPLLFQFPFRVFFYLVLGGGGYAFVERFLPFSSFSFSVLPQLNWVYPWCHGVFFSFFLFNVHHLWLLSSFPFLLLACPPLLKLNNKDASSSPYYSWRLKRTSFLATTPSFLPQHTNEQQQQQRTLSLRGWKVSNFLQTFVYPLYWDPETRPIFLFLCFNLSFMGFQFGYGYYSNSLGLISDAIHMLFDCTAVGFGLVASLMAKWPSTLLFPFGYHRMETLAGLINSVVLVFLSGSIVWEAIERILEPPTIKLDQLLIVAVMGFIVNLTGIVAFHHRHDHDHSHSHSHHPDPLLNHSHSSSHLHQHTHHHEHGHDHDHKHDYEHQHSHTLSHPSLSPTSSASSSSSSPSTFSITSLFNWSHYANDTNMQAVFLHILADALGSFGVIVSTLLMYQFEWSGFDPLASLFIAILILISVIPLLKSSFRILMNSIPMQLQKRAPLLLHELQSLPSYISSTHYLWSHDGVDSWAMFSCQFRSDVSSSNTVLTEQDYRQQVQLILKKYGIQNSVIEIHIQK